MYVGLHLTEHYQPPPQTRNCMSTLYVHSSTKWCRIVRYVLFRIEWSQLYQLLQDKNIIMKFLSIVTVTTVLAAPSAFGNKLHFENVEVSSDALTELSNNGLDEERTPRWVSRPSLQVFGIEIALPSAGSLMVPSTPWILVISLQICHSFRKVRHSTCPSPPHRPFPPEDGACCCRLSWQAVYYQPPGSAGLWRLPPPTVV